MEDIRNRDLAIATAATVNAKRWANGTTTYEKLKERLSKTLRTTETVAEYQHFLKDQKDVAKDHGGFVLGYLDKGRRTIESVQYRDAGAIDSDEIDQAFLTNFENLVEKFNDLRRRHRDLIDKVKRLAHENKSLVQMNAEQAQTIKSQEARIKKLEAELRSKSRKTN